MGARAGGRPEESPIHVNRGLLFWGVALITAGSIALASSQGVIDPSILGDAWRLWPVVLIAIGLSIALSRTSLAWLGTLAAALVVGLAGGALISGAPAFGSCNPQSAGGGSTETSTGTFAGEQATVDLALTCGSLDVTLADGSNWQMDTTIEGGEQPFREDGPSALTVRSSERGIPFDRERQAWAIQLGRDVAYDFTGDLNAVQARIDASGGAFDGLSLTANAGSTSLLLPGARVGDFDLQLNAGSATLIADADTDLAGGMQANAGSIDLCAPDDVGLQVTVSSSVAFSHNLLDRGLDEEGDDTFVSPGFATAAHTIVLHVQGNAASFNLNPEEGCE